MLISTSSWPDDAPGLVPEGALIFWLVELATVPELACLSEDERLRAQAALDPRVGARYRAARTALRLVLAAAVNQRPEDLLFGYNAARQPSLLWPPASGIDFSLAYREGLALIALSRAGPIGADLETVDMSVPAFDIAASEFASEEARLLARLPEEDMALGFTQLWVRKEAVAKLQGTGLWDGLDRPALSAEDGLWHDLVDLPQGFAGAYAIAAMPGIVACKQLRLTRPQLA